MSLERGAVRRVFADFREALRAHFEIEEQVDLGDRVLTRYRSEVRGDHSGVEGEVVLTMVHTFRNGLIVMLEVFSAHDDALRAVALREYAMSQENERESETAELRGG